MDFAKYVAMLQKSALHFPRLDQMQDPFEGTLTRPNFEKATEHSLNQARIARNTFFINCWHLCNFESEAM